MTPELMGGSYRPARGRAKDLARSIFGRVTVPCPTCGAPVALPAKSVKSDFPFCSERCKLVDLGKWADGTYKVSRPLTPEEQDAAEEEAAGRPSRRPSGDDDDE
jgi:endogenous inhibitor of DNA gyrase (YacG/DUF329 family)